jgi:hypothetical protein
MLLRSHDTGYCLVHGTVVEPDRFPWDPADTSPLQQPHRRKCEVCGQSTGYTRLCDECVEHLKQRLRAPASNDYLEPEPERRRGRRPSVRTPEVCDPVRKSARHTPGVAARPSRDVATRA